MFRRELSPPPRAARRPPILSAFVAVVLCGPALSASEAPFLYGIFGHDPDPAEFLGHVSAGAGPGWVTATVQVGADTNETWGVDFSFLANQGHTVICRINYGYFPNGTIPLPDQYDAFAARCASFAGHSSGCRIWTIGNELNLAGEWPVNFTNNHAAYVSPASYATCFRKVYDAIKAVQPDARVLPQAPACFAGPFAANSQNLTWLGTNYTHDANPLTWVVHLRSMLTNIANTGPLDGIALHVASRGYTCAAVHSTAQFSGAAAGLYRSFYVYKDWINLGIPTNLYSLPLYATECNGYYYWKGGHPESPGAHYELGWVQTVYEEINRYNQNAFLTGKPVFRCFNLYRWGPQDEWGIDRPDNLFKSDILGDLDEAVARRYAWPGSHADLLAPVGLNFLYLNPTVTACDTAGIVPQRGWYNNVQGGGPWTNVLDGGLTVGWASPGGGVHAFARTPFSPDDALMAAYLDTSDTSSNTVTVSGLKFPLYDVIVYCDGDNGGAARVGQYTLTTTGGSMTKYVKDEAFTDFSGAFIEADSATGGPATPAGNYCRFRNLRAGSFTVSGRGEYSSDAHPRGPLNAIQIVPIYSVPTLTAPEHAGDEFRFSLEGAAGANYVIQASTNLTQWTAIRTGAAPAQISDPAPPSRRFYRARLQ
jgi:hypothetical protein